MSELPRRRGRCLAASAVAFLLPARRDVPFVFQQTKQHLQTSTQRRCWISSVPPSCPAAQDNIAARPLTTGGENTRRHRCYYVGGDSALFAAAPARKEEEGAGRRLLLEADLTEAEADVEDTELPPGGSGRVAELRSPKRWQRLRSTTMARALGRVFRGRSRLGEEHDLDDTLNSVASVQVLLHIDLKGRTDCSVQVQVRPWL